jgi:ubiquinol-cytochrome c reductase cytochrome c subunit
MLVTIATVSIVVIAAGWRIASPPDSAQPAVAPLPATGAPDPSSGIGAVAQGIDDGAESEGEEESVSPEVMRLGVALYATQCVTCHGADGSGVEGRGPTLLIEGTAAADFVLRTGRMPLPDPDLEARRLPVAYSEEEIVALVAYVGALGDGPEIPDVDPERGDAAEGGELYRLHCAACHVASGAGAPIGGGRHAPPLVESTPTQVGEAILVGPGAMPVFGELTAEEIDDIAAYVGALQRMDTTGATELGGIGPVAEGLAAWLLALVPLVALCRWIGEPRRVPEPSQPDTGVNT